MPPYFLGTMDSKRTGIHLCGWDTGSFYITSLSFVGNDKAIVCFENYPTEHLAAEWVGTTLLVKLEEKAKEEDGSRLVGYGFTTKQKREIYVKVPFPNSLIIP